MILRVQYEELDLVGFDAGGGEMLEYRGQPFTGIIEEFFNGVVISEEEFTDGHLGGIQRTYYPNGILKSEYSIHFNRFDGKRTQWDENGILIRESIWENGICVQDSKYT